MDSIKDMIKTSQQVVPMIYAYSTPEIARHTGWTKIGYTEQDVDKRINQQTHTADVEWKEEWRGTAIYDDGSGDVFKDSDFHKYLTKNGIERQPETEWFNITGPDSRGMFYDFKANKGLIKDLGVSTYKLRTEQEQAVQMTKDYCDTHEEGEFLWNAKPRFGKTLSSYEFCKRVGATKVLIVTNRPAIANSWYSDYEQFLGTESGYLFISDTDALKDRPLVISRKEYIDNYAVDDYKYIQFLSLQDLKGSRYFGGKIDKLDFVHKMTWDVLIIDEAHEGVDTYKSDIAFDHITRKFTLHMSGTAFKAIANDKFEDAAIFNWTYADEQQAKRDWDETSEEENPYETLPKLNLFTYQMSEIVKDEIDQGIEIDGEIEEYAFDLNEFFATDNNGRFIHSSSVDKFLDALTTQEKYPFSTDELRDELKHTMWLLNRVDSAKALARKLEEHPVFSDYEVVVAAGDGRLSEEDETAKAYDRVINAISGNEKTITLTVGQLTTGVTIPEWTAVLMLSNVKSPSLYMQSAFRAQNPCMFSAAGQFFRKENAYVFDFDPARTLIIFEEFANDLYATTAGGRGDIEQRKENIKRLLNFFPVIGEDEEGKMIELDAEKVLTIPRKIKSVEVVKRGFMSNFLFQNIHSVFGAPQAVIDIISNFTPVKEPNVKPEITETTKEDLMIGEDGEVHVTDEMVVGTAEDIFGDKIFDIEPTDPTFIDDIVSAPEIPKSSIDKFKEKVHRDAVEPIISAARDEYQEDMKPAAQRRMERRLKDESDRMIERAFGDYQIEKNTIEKERQDALKDRFETNRTTEEIDKEFEQKQEEAATRFQEKLNDDIREFVKESSEDVVRTVETTKRESEKRTIEDSIRDHLRGFSRTIPSFLMAYGSDEVTLGSFDSIIPAEVFKEVTSISLDQFRFLRDGGAYTDDNGEEQHFDGHLFDPVVFDDSVREFMRLRKKLADYFSGENEEDIFDYIPPQKTNQIFTPKRTVAQMVDMLEEENPGCFDDADKTFIDLYMKSGLYITEIVKRLANSEGLKKQFPDVKDRIRHIFENQVYGLAPTAIIYEIATNYILGFLDDKDSIKHNFRLADALPYAKDGKLEELIDELFPDKDK